MPLVEELDASSLHLIYAAHTLIARNETNNGTTTHSPSRPPIYKVIGLSLAIASGVFIGVSFVLKKMGLLKANVKYNEEAGEGYGYLKNAWWWGGMTLMIVGEVCNFVAYAFTDAILVTPLGALSVVVTTILSAIFLKERLSFVGKVGCFNCIIGSVVIVMNAPEQSAVADIQQMKTYVVAPGFLSYAAVVIVGSAFIALWVGPRYGKKSMFVYLSVCSLIGGLSVVATQGLGAAVVAQADRGNQFNQWFLYVLLVFVVATLLTEIIYLNKALNIFNAALVTPTYYVFFTSTTIITSAVLFRGFHGTPVTIATVIMGFLVICSGVVLLQLSKSAKDVPDAAVFKGDLDQMREVAEQEQAESEPKADAIRGAASIVRRLSTPRRKMEAKEAKRFREEKLSEQLEPLKENEVAEWDGLRRRKTIIGAGPTATPVRRKTIHPPLGMAHFPEETSPDRDHDNNSTFLATVRDRAQTMFARPHAESDPTGLQSPVQPVALTNINFKTADSKFPDLPYGSGNAEDAEGHAFGHGLFHKPSAMPSPRSKPLPASPAPTDSGLRAPGESKRQFSFSNFLRSPRQSSASNDSNPIRPSTAASHAERKARQTATEEERLGLVKGDSSRPLMSDTSPEHRKAPEIYRTESPEAQPSLYTYPSTSGSRRYHRSASPDNLSDDEPNQTLSQPSHQPSHQPFSFSSTDPQYQTAQRPPSRRRPSPPAVYHAPVPAQTSTYLTPDQPPQIPPLPSQSTLKRVTIGSNLLDDQPTAIQAARSAPSLDPPVQFTPSKASRESSPLRLDPGHQNPSSSTPNLTSSELPSRTGPSQDPSPTRSDKSNPGSKERFAEQSARERADRRERNQRRMSQGP